MSSLKRLGCPFKRLPLSRVTASHHPTYALIGNSDSDIIFLVGIAGGDMGSLSCLSEMVEELAITTTPSPSTGK